MSTTFRPLTTGTAPSSRWWHPWLATPGPAVAVYLLAVLATDPHFMADTTRYAEQLTTGSAERIWEFGHLLWRPLGWVLLQLFGPLTATFVGTSPQANAILALVGVSLFAGLVSVVALHGLLRRVSDNLLVVNLVVLAFIFTNGFLNYAQSGASYVAGLALLLVGVYLLNRGGQQRPPSPLEAILAGVSLAGAVGFWFLYVFALPAALASPLFLWGRARTSWRAVLYAGSTVAAGTALLYAAAASLALGITSLPEFVDWMGADRRMGTLRGLPRAVFGFAKSFADMGRDGTLYKRFLVDDPYNPVPLGDLLRFSLWKLALFYAAMAALVVQLARSPLGRRALALLAVWGAPVIGFAVFWQGGDIERYLPLYPMLFLGLAIGGRAPFPWRALVAAPLAFFVVAAATNVNVMALPSLHERQEHDVARVRQVLPLLEEDSRLFTITQRDDLFRFGHDFPFHPLNRDGGLALWYVVDIGHYYAPQWRSLFAERARAVWDEGGEVWVTTRLLATRPQPGWDWVEGGDPRVSWQDLHAFFAALDWGGRAGGEDGFVHLPRSRGNEELLNRLARERSPSPIRLGLIADVIAVSGALDSGGAPTGCT